MTWARGLLLGAAVVLAVGCVAGNASAAGAEAEARERYDRALRLYEEADFDGALVELERAYELRPTYKLLYNIARVRLALNDHASALKAYRRYLEEAGTKISRSRRDQVAAEIKTLEGRVAKLTVAVDVAGAEVFVDDVLVGTSPLPEAVLVNAGLRRISVRHPDHPPQTRRLSLAGGDQEQLEVTLAPPPATLAPPATPAPPPAKPTPTPRPTPATQQPVAQGPSPPAPEAAGTPWFGWALTGVFGAAATTTGVIALSAAASLSDERDQLGVDPADLDSDATRVRTLAVVTDALIAATLITGGITLWMSLDQDQDPKADKPVRGDMRAPGDGLVDRQAPSRGSAALGLNPNGVVFKLAF